MTEEKVKQEAPGRLTDISHTVSGGFRDVYKKCRFLYTSPAIYIKKSFFYINIECCLFQRSRIAGQAESATFSERVK
ncbi:MAG: hypothetical protein WDA26_10130 [Pusillimonas sp.]